MASRIDEGRGGAAGTLLTMIAEAGVASHPYLRDLRTFAGADGTRDLADAVHFLGMLHGRHPGLIDLAAAVPGCVSSTDWLTASTPGFGAERLYVTRLAVAAGPVPSTPGSAECETAVAGQRHALGMLARSERRGCPLGAAIALVADWRPLRPLLDHAAERLGVPVPPCRLPSDADVAAVVDAVGGDPAVGRAMHFGASQVLVQHRGLLDLLDARRSARREP